MQTTNAVRTYPLDTERTEWLVHTATALDIADQFHEEGLASLAKLNYIGTTLYCYTDERAHIAPIDADTHAERAVLARQAGRCISNLINQSEQGETPLFLVHLIQGVMGTEDFEGAPNDDPGRQHVLITEAIDIRGLARANSVEEYAAAMQSWDHRINLQRVHEGMPSTWIHQGKSVCNMDNPPAGTVPSQNVLMTELIIGLSSAYPVLNTPELSALS